MSADLSALPFMIGELIPGYCCGYFDLDTIDQELRVEAVGVDWVLFRGENNAVHLYTGPHQELRGHVHDQLRDNARREEGR